MRRQIVCKMYDNYKNQSNNNYNNNNNSNNNNNYDIYVIIQVWQIFVTVIVQCYCMKLHVMTLNYLKFSTVKLRISKGAKKVNSAACHSGKQQLTCSSPRVNLISPKKKKFWMSKIDNSFSVNFLNKLTCPLEQNSLDQQQDPLVPGYRTRLSLHADNLCTLIRSDGLEH